MGNNGQINPPLLNDVEQSRSESYCPNERRDGSPFGSHRAEPNPPTGFHRGIGSEVFLSSTIYFEALGLLPSCIGKEVMHVRDTQLAGGAADN